MLYTGGPFDPVEIESKLDAVSAKSVREACMSYIYDKCPAVVGYGEFCCVAWYQKHYWKWWKMFAVIEVKRDSHQNMLCLVLIWFLTSKRCKLGAII